MSLSNNEIAQLPIIQFYVLQTSPPKETCRELLVPMEWPQYMSNSLVTAGSSITDERANKTNKQKQKHTE